jgi:hypothetical protein
MQAVFRKLGYYIWNLKLVAQFREYHVSSKVTLFLLTLNEQITKVIFEKLGERKVLELRSFVPR